MAYIRISYTFTYRICLIYYNIPYLHSLYRHIRIYLFIPSQVKHFDESIPGILATIESLSFHGSLGCLAFANSRWAASGGGQKIGDLASQKKSEKQILKVCNFSRNRWLTLPYWKYWVVFLFSFFRDHPPSKLWKPWNLYMTWVWSAVCFFDKGWCRNWDLPDSLSKR